MPRYICTRMLVLSLCFTCLKDLAFAEGQQLDEVGNEVQDQDEEFASDFRGHKIVNSHGGSERHRIRRDASRGMTPPPPKAAVKENKTLAPGEKAAGTTPHSGTTRPSVGNSTANGTG